MGTTAVLAFFLTGLKGSPISEADMPVIGPVADFALTNQDGQRVTLADLRGHVWVADIIFTRCGGPCPRMTRQMRELQDALPGSSDTKLVTLTTDPDYDTTTILRNYSEKFGADSNRWLFLTGTKKQIGALAKESLKLAAVETKPAERQDDNDLFVHTTIFVVVDRQGRLRSPVETEGDGVDWTHAKRKILAIVKALETQQ